MRNLFFKNDGEKMIFKCTVEYKIEIDEENIYTKYPNYKWNYNSVNELADRLIPNGDVYEIDTNMTKDGLKEWGYSIEAKRIKPLNIYTF